jgi:undecaprenyl diphosphate synthase
MSIGDDMRPVQFASPSTSPVTTARQSESASSVAESFLPPNFAMQSNHDLKAEQDLSFHVAMIMDGNGRWASRQGLPRTAGHRAGIDTVRRIAEAAPGLGITKLTLFAFSSDNWRRPPEEVGMLMRLLRTYLNAETDKLIDNGIRLNVIGRRDRLPAALVDRIAAAEAATAGGRRLRLRIALDYSAREAIARAAQALGAAAVSHDTLGRFIAQSVDDDSAPEVDLLIRTGGEKRLSDFLLWECAYAELWFTDRMWPEFNVDDLSEAVGEFRRRERRFGGLTAVPAVAR